MNDENISDRNFEVMLILKVFSGNEGHKILSIRTSISQHLTLTNHTQGLSGSRSFFLALSPY